MKKILITYASYGNGHKAIAEYINEYVNKDNKYEIKMLNILDHTGKLCNFSVKIHNYIYNHHMEHIFTAMYQGANNKAVTNIYNYLFKKIILNKNLSREFTSFNPDLVVSSHFYGSNIAHTLNKKNLLKTKIMTIITDYKIHEFWMANKDKEEIFIVANDIVKSEMKQKGCISNNIYSYGLPFNISQFGALVDKDKVYSKYFISKNKKVLLFFGGGGNGNLVYIKYLKSLLKLNLENIEILFVCGKNKDVEYEALKLKRKYNATYLHVLGFINNVYELMSISYLVITKPGGATVTECLETKKVMLLLPGMGGQEKFNSSFVIKNKHGMKSRFLLTFNHNILKLINNEREYNKYVESYSNVNKNKSLEKISKLVSDILK